MTGFLLFVRTEENKELIDAKIKSWEKKWVNYSYLSEEDKDREWIEECWSC